MGSSALCLRHDCRRFQPNVSDTLPCLTSILSTSSYRHRKNFSHGDSLCKDCDWPLRPPRCRVTSFTQSHIRGKQVILILRLLYSIRSHAEEKKLSEQGKVLPLQQHYIVRRTTDPFPSVVLTCQDSKNTPYQDASKLSLLLALQHQGEVETGL